MFNRLTALALVFLLASCGGASEADKDRTAPLVGVAAVANASFSRQIEAVGTAVANEQVVMTSPVTERIVRLNFDDGGYVQKGQTIAVLAQGQEDAQLAEAQATAREAQQQLERVQRLKQRGFATNASVDTAVATLATARAQAEGARASIGDRVITAPFSGYVSLRTISAGAVVSAGTEIATISDLTPIKADFPVPETLLAAIRTGQPVQVHAAAYPDEEFSGTIDSIDPVVDPATRAVKVRAMLPNPDARLKPGMLLSITIRSDTRTAPSVPELAVIGEGDTRYVFTIDDKKVVHRAPIRTGARQDGRVEVLSGLKPGQHIVTEGVVKLSDGISVRVEGGKPSQAATAKDEEAEATAVAGATG